MTSAIGLSWLLVRFRMRALWNALWRVPRPSFRAGAVLAVAAPVAYVGLFASAFGTAADLVPLPQQAALLTLVAGAIALSSGAAKMASSDAILAGSGENEFLLARPVSLPGLVLARSLAGALTDLFDALFLFPILVAAAVVWGLGAAGVALAALVSMIAQVGVSAAAQAGQIAVAHLVPPRRRRAVWAAVALFAALTMACLWVLASWVLRSPAELVARLAALEPVLRASPAAALTAPLVALRTDGAAAAAIGLGLCVAATAVAVGCAQALAAFAARHGWEQAGQPWAEAARGPRRGAVTTPFTKDWRLVTRDRSRLASLVALPVIFVGIQIFGSAGWDWTVASPQRMAVLAFSLAAYLATIGPVGHMESERRAFWITRVAPVPLGRLVAWKAIFWSALVGGTASLAYAGLVLAAPARLTAGTLGFGVLAAAGAVLVAWLAVGMASGAADLSEEGKTAIGLGTVYLFLVVAGLFNVALIADGEVRWRGLLLFVVAVALHFQTGVEQLEGAFDPEQRAERRVFAADGATLAILLFLGQHARGLTASAMGVEVEPSAWAAAVWATLVGAGAAVYLLRRRAAGPPAPAPALALLLGLGIGAVAALPLGLTALPARLAATPGAALALIAAAAVAEELIFRGVVQRALASRWSGAAGRAGAFGASALIALAAGHAPLSGAALALALVPATAFALRGGLPAALGARLVLALVLG